MGDSMNSNGFKYLLVLVLLFLFTGSVKAHKANIKGYSDKDSKYISFCNNKYYGYHKQKGNNHWHEVIYTKNEWSIVDSSKTYTSDPCGSNNKIKVKFNRCVDGDTVVLTKDGKEEKYRFLAVDTPESVHPTKDVELYAKEASKNTCDLLTNASTIYVEYDSNSDKKDKYNRNLVWIWIDGTLLQELMISEGFARVAYIYGNYKYIDNLCSLEKEAINSNKGIWQYGYEEGYCVDDNKKSSKSLLKKQVYVVSFKDGENITDVTIAQGMKVKPIASPEKRGYIFKGWYHDNKKYDFNNIIESNIMLEAKYKVDYLYIIIVVIVLLFGLTINSKEQKKNGKNRKKSIKHN